MKASLTLTLHLLAEFSGRPPSPKPPKPNSKQEVITIFEEEEKKRETKVDVKLHARL